MTTEPPPTTFQSIFAAMRAAGPTPRALAFYVSPRIHRKLLRYSGYSPAKWRFVQRQWLQQHRVDRVRGRQHLQRRGDKVWLQGIPVHSEKIESISQVLGL